VLRASHLKATNLVLSELERAVQTYSAFNSAHEGYAVILEELDELWEEIRKRNPDPHRIQKEVVQVGAMAIRFLVDVCKVSAE